MLANTLKLAFTMRIEYSGRSGDDEFAMDAMYMLSICGILQAHDPGYHLKGHYLGNTCHHGD